ncbi:class A beta-lactamase [Duganella sp. Leaf126]|uniref:class A beta-lactamase n=1 Tax=Duganella sp. Leaf126 TaxID=1736266 RepID=UPI0006FADBA5|nr:class A beta-lactamase [Duganella sp. Leaf126]KQQ40169.1 class A beta-lactamase [Duganella sp. Leaf126]
MTCTITRRAMLLALVAAPVAGAAELLDRPPAATVLSPAAQLARLETDSKGRLGVAAINTADGAILSHRGDERFPLCSSFKAMLAAAILHQEPSLLDRRIRYKAADLVTYSPVTGQNLADGMTVGELCAAAIQYSDNTAANLLMKLVKGPAGVTAFARTIGDKAFRLDRWETDLSTAIPGDPRDTTTPLAMMKSLQGVTLGPALTVDKRKQLTEWLVGNTTGDTRIRAGVPFDWQVGDKTGTGAHGTTIDIGVVWPPGKAPVVMALYFTQPGRDDAANAEILAAAARVVVEAFKLA